MASKRRQGPTDGNMGTGVQRLGSVKTQKRRSVTLCYWPKVNTASVDHKALLDKSQRIIGYMVT